VAENSNDREVVEKKDYEREERGKMTNQERREERQ